MAKGVALNASRMKSRNNRRVLEELRISPFSRSELSRRMGLTRAAISLIVDALLQSSVLVEGETVASKTAGRSPTELHWNPDAFYCIGVVIRRGYFGVGLYNFCGEKISVERREIKPPFDSRSAIMEEIYRMIDDAVATHKPKGSFLGIGVGAPGPLDAEAGIIETPTNMEILHKAPIVAPLKERYNCPVIMVNDACAHALAELCYGVKDAYDSFMIIEVTGGIGGGLVLNGKPVSGAYGNGNEIGHSTINIFGERCQCGNIGCAELYATMDVVVRRAAERDMRLKTWRDIVDYASEGHAVALEVMREEALYLATLAVNMLNDFNLGAIIFNGPDICYRPQMLLGMVKEQIPDRLLLKKPRKVDFLTSSFTEDADMISAANLAIDHYLQSFDDVPEEVLAPPAVKDGGRKKRA
ncbi:ROK family protein [Clostridia bacterium OttesenSCG-928-O13]|nr:ROK family protein [Clostridia bacterium OttesenSCG-928-O13]